MPSLPPSLKLSAVSSQTKKTPLVTQTDSFQRTPATAAQVRSGMDIQFPINALQFEKGQKYLLKKPEALEFLMQRKYWVQLQDLRRRYSKSFQANADFNTEFKDENYLLDMKYRDHYTPIQRGICLKEYQPEIIVKAAQKQIEMRTHYQQPHFLETYANLAKTVFPQVLERIDQDFLTALEKEYGVRPEQIQELKH